MKKNTNLQQRRIVWVRNIVLDVALHKTTEIGILQHLTKRGYEVFFIAAHSKQRNKFRNSKIHLFSIPVGDSLPLVSRFIFTIVQFLSFLPYLIKVKPFCVITDGDSIFGLTPMLPICRLLGVKVVLDIRSTPTPIENSFRKVGLHQYLIDLTFKASVGIAKRKLDGMTIITALMKKEICDKFHIDPNWVGVWSSGVSTELFRYDKYVNEGIELRKTLGLTGRFIIGYHGGFSQSRGLMDAMGALSIIRNRHPDVLLFMLGTGSVQTICEMRELIQEYGLQDKIILHNAVDYEQVPKYIAMYDVGIVPLPDLPQWRNQCPLKLLEYLAMNKVVILTDISCHREIIGGNKCGIYVPSTRPAEIAECMTFAYDNKEKLKDWGTSGRLIVQNKYTWERVAEDLDNYLTWIENKRVHSI
jgi:glycosyltransferase involved in cell wall biosynthesis